MRTINPRGASGTNHMPTGLPARSRGQDWAQAWSRAAWQFMPERWLLALLSSAALVGLLFGALALYEHAVVSTRMLTPDPPAADCLSHPDCEPEARAFHGRANLPCCHESR